MNDWEITVVPAYGRDYATADEAFAAWMDNKDFRIMTPGHPGFINKQDAERVGIPNNTIRVRFNKATELVFFKYEKEEWVRSMATNDEEEEEIE